MTTSDALAELIDTLTALREHREQSEALLERKRQALRAYAAQAKNQGVSGRQLPHHLHDELRARGWTEEQIKTVGVSPGALRTVLG